MTYRTRTVSLQSSCRIQRELVPNRNPFHKPMSATFAYSKMSSVSASENEISVRGEGALMSVHLHTIDPRTFLKKSSFRRLLNGRLLVDSVLSWVFLLCLMLLTKVTLRFFPALTRPGMCHIHHIPVSSICLPRDTKDAIFLMYMR